MIWLLLAALVCTILITGFYSGIETGAYCVNRARLQVALDGKRRNAEMVSSLLASMPVLIATTLVGTNIAVYTSTAIVTAWFQRAGFHYAEIGATLALTPILFVFAEVTPKTLYARNADSLFYTMAPLLRASKIAFRPATLVLGLVIGLCKRVFGLSDAENELVLSHRRLRLLFQAGTSDGVLSKYQHTLVLDLFLDADGDDPVRRWTHEVPVFSPTTPVLGALYDLQRSGIPLGIVCEPEGRQVGIVTAKDLVEEICGELVAW